MSVSTQSQDPVDAVYTLLNDAAATTGGYGLSYGYIYGGGETWTNDAPEVYKRQNVSPKGRRNNPKDALYVWSPVESTRDTLGAEYEETPETQTVEIACWTLDNDRTFELAGDVEALLEEYGRDNEGRTSWTQIRPTGDNDQRAEKIVRKSDHYVGTVTVELEALRSTGVA